MKLDHQGEAQTTQMDQRFWQEPCWLIISTTKQEEFGQTLLKISAQLLRYNKNNLSTVKRLHLFLSLNIDFHKIRESQKSGDIWIYVQTLRVDVKPELADDFFLF